MVKDGPLLKKKLATPPPPPFRLSKILVKLFVPFQNIWEISRIM